MLDLIKSGLSSLPNNSSLKKEELFQTLRSSISEMLDREPDLLVSSLYRMDIPESKVRAVLAGQSDGDIASGLATLVIERQKAALESRDKFPQKSINDPEAAL